MAATMAGVFLKGGLSVSAVASSSPERAIRFCKAFGISMGDCDLMSVLDRADVDAVYVANSPSEHAETVVAALRAGKAVLCEKPMATNETELKRIVEVAQQRNVLCMEAIWTLCLPAYLRFRDYAASGEWGRAQSLSASFGYPSSVADEKRLEGVNRGGILLDRGIYLIALALSLLGPVEAIDAKFHFDSTGTDVEAFLQLEHTGGAHSQLASSFSSLMANTAALHCSRGLIEIKAPLIGSETISTVAARPSDGDWSGSAGRVQRMRSLLRESPSVRSIKRVLDRPSTQHFGFGRDSYLPQLHHFLTLLANSKTQSDLVPLALSMQCIQIIDKAKALAIG